MYIPLRYNLRNLLERRVTTAVTVLGLGISVAVFVAVMGLVEGIRNTFVSTGHALNVLVLREGAQSETGSIIVRDAADVIRGAPGIAPDENGVAMVSLERVVYVNLPRRSSGSSNVVIRGMPAMGRRLRPDVHLTDGRWFRPGARELVVSGAIAARFRHCSPGDQLKTGRVIWTVVGIFDAGQTAYASEMWTDGDDVAGAFSRFNHSVGLVRAADAQGSIELQRVIAGDRRASLAAMPETDYYAQQTKAAAPIRILGNIIALVMAIGSAFAAMNTMYAAVAARGREIAVLRALGFSNSSIMLSFLTEAAMLAVAGGVLGGLATLPINGLATGTTNWFSFSEMTFQFRITTSLLARGVAFALIVGLAGGILPALRASRQTLANALRAL
ncbi:MAG TPA: FtsX-like permease family protein [Thermoanaerobaculia bacterium]|nr:FtsX-like permease family protein [Thermoanaerobaculia bacterium]